MKKPIALTQKNINYREEITSLSVLSVSNGNNMRKIYVDTPTSELSKKLNGGDIFLAIFDIFDNTVVINRNMVATIDCIVATKVTLDTPSTSKGLTRTENWFFGECEIHEGYLMLSENAAKPIPENEDMQICG